MIAFYSSNDDTKYDDDLAILQPVCMSGYALKRQNKEETILNGKYEVGAKTY